MLVSLIVESQGLRKVVFGEDAVRMLLAPFMLAALACILIPPALAQASPSPPSSSSSSSPRKSDGLLTQDNVEIAIASADTG